VYIISSKTIEGRDAASAGLDIINNPYAAGSADSEAWLRGWFGQQDAWLGNPLTRTVGIRLPSQPAIKAA
jgi:hypothetical protein